MNDEVSDEGIVAEVIKVGGKATRTDNMTQSAENLKTFVLVGLASRYCEMVSETIASSEQSLLEWKLNKLTGFALAFVHLRLDGEGPDPGTCRFVPIKGIDDYSGTSGGPVFAYAEGALTRDYCLFGIQSKQILEATREQKPKHLIVTSAGLAVKSIADYLAYIRTLAAPSD